MSHPSSQNDIENPVEDGDFNWDSPLTGHSNHTRATSNRRTHSQASSTSNSNSKSGSSTPRCSMRSDMNVNYNQHPVIEEELPISLPYPNDDASTFDQRTLSSAGTVSELSFAHSLSSLMSFRTERTDEVSHRDRQEELINQVTQRNVLPASSSSGASVCTSHSARSASKRSYRHHSSGAMTLPTRSSFATETTTTTHVDEPTTTPEKDLLSPESNRTNSTRTSIESSTSGASDYVRSDLHILPEEDDDASVQATIFQDEAGCCTCCVDLLQSIGCQCILILILLCLVGLMIAVIVLMVHGKLDTLGGNDEKVLVTPETFVQPLEARLFETLPLETRLALADRDTPQAQAYEWIVQYDSSLVESVEGALRQQVPNWRLQQLFALVTFYYNYGGQDWPRQANWLRLDVPECNWDSLAILCHPDGTIQELRLESASSASLPLEVDFLPFLETLTLEDKEFSSPNWPN